MEWYFAKVEERTVKNDGTIHYDNRVYQIQENTVLKSKKISVKKVSTEM
jgi:hypothetical protein